MRTRLKQKPNLAEKFYEADDQYAISGHLDYIFNSLQQSGTALPRQMSKDAKDYLIALLKWTRHTHFEDQDRHASLYIMSEYFIARLRYDQPKNGKDAPRFKQFNTQPWVHKRDHYQSFIRDFLPKMQDELSRRLLDKTPPDLIPRFKPPRHTRNI